MDCAEEGKVAFGPKQKDADLWRNIWELFNGLRGLELGPGREVCKAHRTEKEKKTMTDEEQFVMEGNEKADALAKDGTALPF